MERSVPLTDYLYHKSGAARIPLSGTFELSPVCNLACRMCYVRKTAREVQCSQRPLLSLEQWLDIARQARDAGMLFLLLTGGEPLAWPDFWTLYEELIRMGFLISINTNGTLIDETAAERLRALPPRRVNITLYGAGNETYRRLCGAEMFGNVDRGIHLLQAAGVNLKLNGSFTPYNLGDLEEIVAYARSNELPLQTTAYMLPPVRRRPDMVGRGDRLTPEEAAECRIRCHKLQAEPEAHRDYLERILGGWAQPPVLEEGCVDPLDGRILCRAGSAAFWVTWDGWMTPCGMMNEPKVDLSTGEFSRCWEEITKRCAAMRLSGVCGQCANRTLCHPCAAVAMAETGTPGGIPEYLCETALHMRRLAGEELEKLRREGT